MRQTLYILTLSILTTSCATLLNQPYKNVTILTTEPSTIIHNQDTVNTIDNKAHLRVDRKNEPLSIIATTDDLAKSIELKPRNSFLYWINISNYGIGMLVDKNNPKRYAYPDKIWINSVDDYSKFGRANNKGELYLHLSSPLSFNFFLMAPENERVKANVGLPNLAIGLDYYHSKNQFIHLGISRVYREGVNLVNYEVMKADYICLLNNHKNGRFSIGYGLYYAKNTWEHHKGRWWFFIPIIEEKVKKSHNSFGFIFPTYYQLGEYFNMGFVYRPTFYRPNMPDKFAYEHLISVDFAWKIRVKR